MDKLVILLRRVRSERSRFNWSFSSISHLQILESVMINSTVLLKSASWSIPSHRKEIYIWDSQIADMNPAIFRSIHACTHIDSTQWVSTNAPNSSQLANKHPSFGYIRDLSVALDNMYIFVHMYRCMYKRESERERACDFYAYQPLQYCSVSSSCALYM